MIKYQGTKFPIVLSDVLLKCYVTFEHVHHKPTKKIFTFPNTPPDQCSEQLNQILDEKILEIRGFLSISASIPVEGI